MPYEIKPEQGGFVVMNKETGATYSNRPLPLMHAKAQLKALYASEKRQVPIKEMTSKRTKVSGRGRLYSKKTASKEAAALRNLY